jgi:hypothetical protein
MPPIEDWFRFVYLDESGLEEAGLDEADLSRFEAEIVNDPKVGPVIKGTGGLRKFRLAREGTGKSGGARICYVVFSEHGVVIVPLVYGKTRKEDLSAAEKRYFKAQLLIYGKLLDADLT